MTELTPLAKELLDGPNYAVVATVNPDGSLQQSVVWLRERDGEVVYSTVEGRAKHRNLILRPTTNVLVLDAENPYRFVSISGTARFESENADALIDELSKKYTGEAWVEHATAPRVNVVVTPTRVTDRT